MAEQAQDVRAALAALDGPVTAEQLAKAFTAAPLDRVGEVLAMLVSLGQTAIAEGGRFAPA